MGDPEVIRQAHSTPRHALCMPAKTSLASDKVDAASAYAVPFRPYSGDVGTRTRNVSEYMRVLTLCLVFLALIKRSTDSIIWVCAVYRNYHYYYISLTAFFPGQYGYNLGISRHQKGQTIRDFTGARDDGRHWHQLDHMQIIAPRFRQITTPVHHHSFVFTGRLPFLPPKQCQSTVVTVDRKLPEMYLSLLRR